MNDRHTPTPEFVDRVEREIGRSMRAANSFGRARSGPSRAFWIVLVALASALLGAGGAMAAERARSEKEAALIVRRAEVRFEAARRRTALSNERLARLNELAAAGAVSATQLARAREALDEDAQYEKRTTLELEEVRASKAPVRDDLAAPLVGGRDFVTERLAVDLAYGKRARERALTYVKTVRRLHEMGAMPQTELAAAGLVADVSARAVATVEERMGLRKRFTSGAETAERIDLLGMRAEAKAEKEAGEVRLAAARHSLGLAERLHNAGAIGQDEIERLKARVEAAKQEVDLAELDLEILSHALGEK